MAVPLDSNARALSFLSKPLSSVITSYNRIYQPKISNVYNRYHAHIKCALISLAAGYGFWRYKNSKATKESASNKKQQLLVPRYTKTITKHRNNADLLHTSILTKNRHLYKEINFATRTDHSVIPTELERNLVTILNDFEEAQFEDTMRNAQKAIRIKEAANRAIKKCLPKKRCTTRMLQYYNYAEYIDVLIESLKLPVGFKKLWNNLFPIQGRNQLSVQKIIVLIQSEVFAYLCFAAGNDSENQLKVFANLYALGREFANTVWPIYFEDL